MGAREVLKANRLFSKFSDNGVALIASVAEERVFPPNTPIFVENMLGESMFFIESGEVVVQVSGKNGKVEIGRLSAGDHFGQLSLVKPGQRRVSAVAQSECRLIEVARRPFLKLQATKPQACIKLLLAICEEYVELTSEAAPLMIKAVSGA